MNPPYTTFGLKKIMPHGIYHKFVKLSISLCKPNGYINNITPQSWRTRKRYTKLYNEIRNLNVIYIDMYKKDEHGFDICIPIDIYLIENKPIENNYLTNIDNGEMWWVNLNEWPFLPSDNYELFEKLLAKDKERAQFIIGNQRIDKGNIETRNLSNGNNIYMDHRQ